MLVSAHIVDIALMGSTSPNQRVKILPLVQLTRNVTC